ncbi:hypothetical protein sscle_01g009340 [Sclerotinia sclerotiorum 1980 UF-70]|uniref:CBM1 domain-containing protein n=1 Tax=Sclerotinia sclerotiorum (strain ATCC 18683 / 1980 / Ss-1) TaxID=665079 RepID=A0A1D9PTX2_SCLS1|nr:hypothetical protein sscle_01g009340 [Sclerotinia sclerotiorum 1980 UF-70]
MHFYTPLRVTLLIAVGMQEVYAQQSAWGQCGGTGWAGATTCVSGYVCTYSNSYYSQCLPGTASSSTGIATSGTATSGTASSGTPTTTVPATTTGAASYPGVTLQSGYYWIRAVESPNFHSYLQASPTGKPGRALLADRSTAGQYQIVSGQLVQLVAPNTFLYANVQPPASSSAVKLSMTFNTTQNTFGTFAFSGDAVTWSVASISRPNLSAWLVCGDQELWINLGNYAYLTPTGCVDETIHYFNGATVD